MANHEPHIDGTVQCIEDVVEIQIGREFASCDAAPEGDIGLGAARLEKALTKGAYQGAVTLPGTKNGRNHMTAAAAQNFHKLPHLLIHVFPDGARVRKPQLRHDAAGECICHKGGLGGPPAIDRGLADACLRGYIFDREICEAVLFPFEELERAVQDGLACALAAGTARRWRSRRGGEIPIPCA